MNCLQLAYLSFSNRNHVGLLPNEWDTPKSGSWGRALKLTLRSCLHVERMINPHDEVPHFISSNKLFCVVQACLLSDPETKTSPLQSTLFFFSTIDGSINLCLVRLKMMFCSCVSFRLILEPNVFRRPGPALALWCYMSQSLEISRSWTGYNPRRIAAESESCEKAHNIMNSPFS